MSGGCVGVILAAGRGSRMGTLGEEYAKALLPVGNRPLIHHHLGLLDALGAREIFLVVGHRALDLVGALGERTAAGVPLRYVEQGAPLGSAHALGRVRPYVQEPFLLVLGDYYFAASEPARMLHRLEEGASAIAAVREPDRRLLSEACALEVDGEGRVRRIVEKPRVPASDLKGCGFYALQPEVFDAVARTPRTALRDEYELTVSLELYISRGHRLYAEEILLADTNLTRPADLLECNLRWLQREGRSELIAGDARVEGEVRLHQALVGSGARIAGPWRLEETVVFPGTQLEGGGEVRRGLVTPRGLSLVPTTGSL